MTPFIKKKRAITAGILFYIWIFSAGVTFADEGQSPILFSQNQQVPDINPTSALYRMILAILIVVALGVAAIYISKKVLPKFANTQGKKIKILESVHLGPRKVVHLLEVGGQQILIGSTNDHITKLADIIDVVFEKDAPLKQTHTQKDIQ